MKSIFSIILLLLSIISFSQEKLIEKITINNMNFRVVEKASSKNEVEKVYEVQKLLNDSILSKIEIIKSYKNEVEDYNSTFKLVDSVFTFYITLKKNEQTLYGTNRVFIGSRGSIFNGIEYDGLTTEKPKENTYPAQFDGGLITLRKWVQNSIDAQNLLNISGKENLKFNLNIDIDETGTAVLTEITGNDHPEIKTKMERMIKKMPKWIPAKEDNKRIKAKFNIPIDVIGTN